MKLGNIGVLDRAGQDLMRAAAYIDEHGWCQHALATNAGAVCMVGALNSVGASREAWFRIQKHLGVSLPSGIDGWPIAHFNDAETTTKEAVLDKLITAALSEER